MTKAVDVGAVAQSKDPSSKMLPVVKGTISIKTFVHPILHTYTIEARKTIFTEKIL